MAGEDADKKLALPAFLKVLTNGKMTMAKAMGVAGKVFKEINTPSELGKLTDAKLQRLGVESKEDRKLALEAIKKAGFVSKAPTNSVARTAKNGKVMAVGGAIAQTEASTPGAGPSRLVGKKEKASPKPNKRKRDEDLDQDLPSGPQNETLLLGNLDFNEELNEEVLTTKATVVNRAPVMSLWSTIVAERLGFSREEALSIGAAYTEMNAVSKGASLGIFKERDKIGMEAVKGGAQPYVELMGRRPLYETSDGSWRALSKGEPIEPGPAYSYITRAFRQTLPFIAGAMRLLSLSFLTTRELNEKGFALYADFRPSVAGWGQRAEVRCSVILEGRSAVAVHKQGIVDFETHSGVSDMVKFEDERAAKKTKTMTVEEYEANLDMSPEFEDFINSVDC